MGQYYRDNAGGSCLPGAYSCPFGHTDTLRFAARVESFG